MNKKNCHKFKKKKLAGDEHYRNVCQLCGYIDYGSPQVVAGSIVTYKNKFLLCKRGIHPGYGLWTLPSGFVEKNGLMGSTNTLENSSTYKFDENNQLSFKSRRNRKLNLTEFYDLVYEYKNDCLTAGIKYRKTYYEDRELKPSEDLLFTITFYPLTTYEQDIDDSLYN